MDLSVWITYFIATIIQLRAKGLLTDARGPRLQLAPR